MKIGKKSFTTKALVLSHRKVGETDRITTLFSQQHGKITVVAKGVRKMTSSKKAVLEPGNVVNAFCLETKSMPILTQATLISDCMPIRTSLQKLRQLSQLLEVVDRLFVEEELDSELFNQVLATRHQIVSPAPTKASIFDSFDSILTALGYQPLADSGHNSLLEYVEAITERPMKSWAYLKVQ